MNRLLSLTFATAVIATASAASADPVLKTLSVDIPQGGPTFPGGDKANAVNTHCLICHSAEMVLDQPAMPKEEWAKEVKKMQKVYGAPIQDADIPAVIDYLVSLRSAD